MKICLDAGHSYGLNRLGKDPGAVNTELGLKESIIAMEMVNTLKKMFTDKGYEIILTRSDGDDKITLMSRCKIANSNNVDLFISVHLNSSDNSSAKGIEVLRYPTRNEKTIRIANAVQNYLIQATGARNRGVKERGDLCVLKHTDMPAILIETGFISNKEEGLKLNDPAYQRVICNAIVEAVDVAR